MSSIKNLCRPVKLLLIVTLWSLQLIANSQTNSYDSEAVKNAMEVLRKSNSLPFPVPMMMQPPDLGEWTPNTVTQMFPPEARQAMMQNLSASNPWSLRQVFSFMTLKMKANEELEFEDVIEAMDSRAVEENLKKSLPLPLLFVH